MKIEWEAKFLNINKKEIRNFLKKIGAQLIQPEFLQKRFTFSLPLGQRKKNTWIRLRKEKEKITLTLKEVKGQKIKDQKEILLVIDDFEKGKNFLKAIGCKEKAYQENKREIWEMDGVEITIEEWPFLEPFVEIEGKSEKEVKKIAEKLGFNWKDAVFGAVSLLFSKKYKIPEKVITDKIDKIVFGEKNPFIIWRKNGKNK